MGALYYSSGCRVSAAGDVTASGGAGVSFILDENELVVDGELSSWAGRKRF